MARPSSSTTTAVSRMLRPTPPYSSGMARAGQSRATMEPHSFSGASPVSTTARTTSTGHSFSRNERTEERSSSCSPVNSSSTALPSRPRRLPLDPARHRRRRQQTGASVPDARVSLRGLCYLHGAPFSGKDVGWVCPGGVAGPRRKPGPATRGFADATPSERRRPLAYTLRCASSSTAEQRTLNPQVSGSNPEGRTRKPSSER